MTERLRFMLNQLSTLLSIAGKGDRDQPTLTCVAKIDPNDPVVEEILSLSEELKSAFADVEERRVWAKMRKNSAATQ